MKIPFKLNTDESILNDLNKRLKNTRWANEIDNDKWKHGTSEKYLKDLCNYWNTEFDWKKQEAYLNSFDHFKSDIDGNTIHFIHQKGSGSNSIPLLLVHGWPDSFVRFLKIAPLLTQEDSNGVSFDIIIPSIPGYGFSDLPDSGGLNPKQIAKLFTKLVTDELGYKQFIAFGGDQGSGIIEQIGLYHSDSLLGIYFTNIPYTVILTTPKEKLNKEERKFVDQLTQWQMTEGAYGMIQSTKPQTLAYALNDSPVGLAAWIVEKFQSWSDSKGDIESVFTKDELLTNIMIYWITQSIGSSFQLYAEVSNDMIQQMFNPLTKINPFDKTGKKIDVPVALGLSPVGDPLPPKEFVKKYFNLVHWTVLSRGGHFGAMEQPEILAADLRKFIESMVPIVQH